MPPMAEALQTGWFDATFPDASDVSSNLMLDPETSAAIAAFRMATGDWSQGFKLLIKGLSAGYPDARAYQQPYAAYVDYGLTQHSKLLSLDQDADMWVERLTEIFVLQAFNVRYLIATWQAAVCGQTEVLPQSSSERSRLACHLDWTDAG